MFFLADLIKAVSSLNPFLEEYELPENIVEEDDDDDSELPFLQSVAVVLMLGAAITINAQTGSADTSSAGRGSLPSGGGTPISQTVSPDTDFSRTVSRGGSPSVGVSIDPDTTPQIGGRRSSSPTVGRSVDPDTPTSINRNPVRGDSVGLSVNPDVEPSSDMKPRGVPQVGQTVNPDAAPGGGSLTDARLRTISEYEREKLRLEKKKAEEEAKFQEEKAKLQAELSEQRGKPIRLTDEEARQLLSLERPDKGVAEEAAAREEKKARIREWINKKAGGRAAPSLPISDEQLMVLEQQYDLEQAQEKERAEFAEEKAEMEAMLSAQIGHRVHLTDQDARFLQPRFRELKAQKEEEERRRQEDAEIRDRIKQGEVVNPPEEKYQYETVTYGERIKEERPSNADKNQDLREPDNGGSTMQEEREAIRKKQQDEEERKKEAEEERKKEEEEKQKKEAAEKELKEKEDKLKEEYEREHQGRKNKEIGIDAIKIAQKLYRGVNIPLTIISGILSPSKDLPTAKEYELLFELEKIRIMRQQFEHGPSPAINSDKPLTSLNEVRSDSNRTESPTPDEARSQSRREPTESDILLPPPGGVRLP